MADTRRGKQKRKQRVKDEKEKPSKEEYAVGKFLKFHQTLNKDGKFLGNNTHYFVGSKAIDVLLESKWAAKSGKTDPLLTNRSACEAYLERLLEKGFFLRVQKLEKRDKKKKLKEGGDKKVAKEDTPSSKKGDKKSKKEKEETEPEKEKEVELKDVKEKEGKKAETKSEKTEKPKEESVNQTEERKRRKKRAKLEMHEVQVFLDGPELYVWMYDPVPAKTFIIGLLLVLGAIAVCLFPLWPPEVRLGVYYLSIAAACFVGLIIGLCIVRVILFAVVWAVTLGKVSFWLLPNLTEDVSFVDSFRPLYKYDVNNKTAATDDGQQKADGNDDEQTNEAEDCNARRSDEEKEDLTDEEMENNEALAAEEDFRNDEDDADEERADITNDEGEDENGDDDDDEGGRSGSSSNDNGYEILDAQEIENVGRQELVDDETSEQTHQAAVRHRKGKKPARKEL